jgi:hypothetical protein
MVRFHRKIPVSVWRGAMFAWIARRISIINCWMPCFRAIIPGVSEFSGIQTARLIAVLFPVKCASTADTARVAGQAFAFKFPFITRYMERMLTSPRDISNPLTAGILKLTQAGQFQKFNSHL